MVIDDRDDWSSTNPTPLFDAFATAHEVDLRSVREEVAEQVEDETKEQLAAINQALKDLEKPAGKAKNSTAKTTSTPPPAGAAIGTGEADAKKQKPAASRKAKTTAQEAISGIAAAMQGMGSEPLDAALGGSEAAAGEGGVLAVGVTVKVRDGKHRDRVGAIANDGVNDKWDVTLYNALGMPFVASLPTKSLEIAEL